MLAKHFMAFYKFYKFIYTGAQMVDCIYHRTYLLNSGLI